MPETPATETLLLVDPDLDFLDWATKHLAADGLRILRCDNAENAIKVLTRTPVTLMVADFDLQPFDGLELLARTRQESPHTLVILTAGFPTTGQIIEATQRGAHDVLRKESLPFELRPIIESALQTQEDRRSAGSQQADLPPATDGRVKIIGISRALQDVFKLVGRVARTDAPVLIVGESGTGKELVAMAIHEYSPRRKLELITLNCGAIPENLLESELFGHEKGSFTGASERRIGRFEQAKGGTLFLDEIGEIDAATQVKILRVLGERTFERVGGSQTLQADVRLITATNRDLGKMVAEGTFREDLFFRLHVVPLTMPPLRDRKVDIPLLVETFLKDTAAENGKPLRELTSEAMNAILEYDWPGNVRELRTAIEHGVVMASSQKITLRDLPAGLRSQKEHPVAAPPSGLNLQETETAFILRALDDSRGNRTEAARMLGISRRTLHRRLKELNISKHSNLST